MSLNKTMTRLAKLLKFYTSFSDKEAKEIAAEIGINESTFTRVKQGKMPNAVNLVKIMNWMLQEEK